MIIQIVKVTLYNQISLGDFPKYFLKLVEKYCTEEKPTS